MTLAILLPSRGRPDNLKRFLQAVEATAEDSFVFVRLDDDDPQIEQYKEMLRTTPLENYHVTQGERIGMAPSVNQCAAFAVQMGYDHVGMFGDDVLPTTPGWDVALMNGLGGRLGVAYGDDGLRQMHAPDLPTHYVTQAEVYIRLGYLAPPGMKHLFQDDVMREIGRYLHNLVFVPVDIKHLHPWIVGEHIADQTYAEGGRNRQVREADAKVFRKWFSNPAWKDSLS